MNRNFPLYGKKKKTPKPNREWVLVCRSRVLSCIVILMEHLFRKQGLKLNEHVRLNIYKWQEQKGITAQRRHHLWLNIFVMNRTLADLLFRLDFPTKVTGSFGSLPFMCVWEGVACCEHRHWKIAARRTRCGPLLTRYVQSLKSLATILHSSFYTQAFKKKYLTLMKIYL